jgi:DNA-binding NtrC family response regulator
MVQRLELAGSEREFFALVSSAAFVNPFSDERVEIDLKIAGAPPGVSGEGRTALLIPKVTERLEAFAEAGKADLGSYAGDDRETVETVFLFDTYHRYLGDFDQLIRDQIEAGDEPCPVPFAKKALSEMRRRGFEAQEAVRYFAMLYQLRRAYFFIGQGMVGRSRSMKELRRRLWNNVITHNIRWYVRHLLDRMEDFSTLLLGETGTGKGTAAAAIGRSGLIPFDEKSGRFVESFTKAFVFINLSQFPEALLESELFGHRKGAFTGAVESHEGIFSRCSPHGAIFLDEIGEVPVTVQIKLLQVLQERLFSPVGSHEKRRFRGRVVAATNRPLRELRQKGGLRDDFFYRLCSDIITVPPLRERLEEDPGELDELLSHVLYRMTGGEPRALMEKVREALSSSLPARYSWPGNVRELEQCVRRILLTNRYEGDESGCALDPRGKVFEGIDAGAFDAQSLLSAYCFLLYQRHPTLAEVARRTKLDRRTVRKHIEAGRGLL